VQCCACCGIHLTSHDEIVSKAFQGRHGRAYLFSNVVNVDTGPTENRLLLTGLHVVCDIYCNACDTRLGWKYVEAFEESQKYKEGKFILEKAMIVKEAELRRRESEKDAHAAEQRADEGVHEDDGDDYEEDEEEDEEEDDDEAAADNDEEDEPTPNADTDAARQLLARNAAMRAAAEAEALMGTRRDD